MGGQRGDRDRRTCRAIKLRLEGTLGDAQGDCRGGVRGLTAPLLAPPDPDGVALSSSTGDVAQSSFYC